MKKFKTALIIILAIALVIAILLLFGGRKKKEVVINGYAMGSVTTFKYFEDKAFDLSAANELENLISNKIDNSEISRLNENLTAELSDITKEILEYSLKVAKKSDGAFDITLGKLTDIWESSALENIVPSENILKSLLKDTGYKKLKIKKNTATIEDGMKIDLGAVGKGAACDVIINAARENGINAGIVTVGGSVGAFGKNPSNNKGWTIGIRNPDMEIDDQTLMNILIKDGFVSTSGNYEKYYEIDGVKFHHILDPDTGFPSDSGLKQVTVICDNGGLSDALSTACFILGYEKSKELLDYYDAGGIFVTESDKIFIIGEDFEVLDK